MNVYVYRRFQEDRFCGHRMLTEMKLNGLKLETLYEKSKGFLIINETCCNYYICLYRKFVECDSRF